ncbi:MAG: 28S ribosomal protein S5, mitochondrial [Geoglossum umbratile]|nr:MAG: 28S ribosomal protein S5, mitochondrial [Geoglossum umbratile]
MSAARPIRCLLSRPIPAKPTCFRSRPFHSSPSHCARRKTRSSNAKAEDVAQLPSPHERFKPYSEAEKVELAKRYSPEQLKAIEAGEQAIDPEDLLYQGELRQDPFMLNYLDDLSTIRPVIDKPVRNPESNYDPNLRLKNENEIVKDFARWVKDLPPEPSRLDYMKFMDNRRLTVGDEMAEKAPVSALAPKLPVIDDPELRYAKEGREDDPNLLRLMQQTGFTKKDLRKIRTKTLVTHTVVNQTRMGKIRSWYYLSVAGNGNGLLGIGEGKAAEPEDARKQSEIRAIRALEPITRYENRTIYGEVKGKVGAVELKLMSRPPGFGVRCQQYIFEMCRLAGITDLAARSTRSRNPMNTIKATFQALKKQRLPEDIARARSLKMVDVRKVYYGGLV